MNFLLQCDDCGARVWATGSNDPSTGAIEIDDYPDEWEPNPKLEYNLIEWCNHVEFTVLDAEANGPLWDDVL